MSIPNSNPKQSGDHRGGQRRDGGRGRQKKEAPEFLEEVIDLSRVAKVVKGGRRFALRAVVCIGDGNGKVGIGAGKSVEVMNAIQKAHIDAKRNLFVVKRRGTTIPHEVVGHFKAAKVILKPAAEGTGVIAGGPVRAIAKCSGIRDLLSKSLGADSKINIAKATLSALATLHTREEIAARRGKSMEDLKG